jgi:trehalose-6-phosphate synthase
MRTRRIPELREMAPSPSFHRAATASDCFSNRLPVTVTEEDGRPIVRQSVGGLGTGLRGLHERSGGLWIGWPANLSGLHPTATREVLRQLGELGTVPVPLTTHEVEVFYEEISNAVLWSICHDRVEMLPLRVTGWEVYEEANSRFADVIADQRRPGDLVWVHDYQLFRVPALLRQRIPEARLDVSASTTPAAQGLELIGSQSVKREPRPTSLSRVRAPPRSWAMRRAMASPRPAPG